MKDNGRLSASERRIAAMQEHIDGLEMMKHEFMALMHYLVETHNGEFDVEADRMKVLKANGTFELGIRTVIMHRQSDGKTVMRMTRIDKPPDQPLIIIPK